MTLNTCNRTPGLAGDPSAIDAAASTRSLRRHLGQGLQRRALGPLATLFMVLGLAAPAAADRHAHAFRARLAVTEILNPASQACGGLPQGTSTGTGTATHMGRVQLAATDCVLVDPQTLLPAGFAGGQLTLTAANGDTLSATYAGSVALGTSGLELTGTYTVVAGTGRYEGASGSGTLTGTLVIDPTNPLLATASYLADGDLLLAGQGRGQGHGHGNGRGRHGH